MVATQVKPHCKISWGGELGNPAAEVWANGLSWVPKGDDMSGVIALGLAGEQEQMAGLSTAIQNWFQTPATFGGSLSDKGAGIAPTAKLHWVKFNAVGADGKYLFASNTFFYPAAIAGGGVHGVGGVSAPFTPPWQMTTAITLRGTVSRGRGSHGRIYPPLAGVGPTVDLPYEDVAVATQMTNSFVGLLDNINDGLYNTYDTSGAAEHHIGNCVIVSTVPLAGPHAGAPAMLTPIVSVEIDRVPDVQTRRVNRVPRLTAGSQQVTLNV